MSHFSPAELVDAAEGTLPAERAGHLEACPRCREQVALLGEARQVATASDVPEPSPLYWQHLSSRVRERVAGEAILPRWRIEPWRALGGTGTLVPLASAIAVVILIAASGLRPRHTPPVPAPAATTAAGVVTWIDPGSDLETSDVWQVLAAAASEVPIEDAHDAGMHVTAGTVDTAVQRMTPEELNELGRLLQSELRRAGD